MHGYFVVINLLNIHGTLSFNVIGIWVIGEISPIPSHRFRF